MCEILSVVSRKNGFNLDLLNLNCNDLKSIQEEHCLLCNNDNFDENQIIQKSNKLLYSGGSNNQKTLQIQVDIAEEESLNIIFQGQLHSTEDLKLHQPFSTAVKNDTLSAILWNGEVLEAKVKSEMSYDSTSILKFVSDYLDTSEILRASYEMFHLKGSWAFVYYKNKKLVFGKDFMGGKSLLIGIGQGLFRNYLMLSSKSLNYNQFHWVEVDTRGLYVLDLVSGVLELQQWPNSCRIQKINCQPSTNLEKLQSENLVEIQKLLQASVKQRILFTSKEHDLKFNGKFSPIAVLFSGGLDSSLLAALTHLELDEMYSIDLINVAFGSQSEINNVPDRQTAIRSYNELCETYSNRTWRLVLVDIEKSELYQNINHIAMLVHPKNSIMDMSIAAPLWFASRGIGLSPLPSSKTDGVNDLTKYETPAEVLFSGIGADEQFAGYSRHRCMFNRKGYVGLCEEIQTDVERLWCRNLGRDDRVISDHGKKVRFPFLDYTFMNWVASKSINELCNMELPNGIGDKQLLRVLAQKMGLNSASRNPKRAIQFGTKIVKNMPRGNGKDLFVI